jgi:2-polyprenyl-3-methyl-5-hydroxy-6-metoxy-1,4-benzoquinol methylase
MLYDDRTMAYLAGDGIANSHWVKIPKQPLIARNILLTQLAQGKTVLHIGCADHPELIEKKRQAGNYLHDMLAKVATKVLGCDVNQAALTKMGNLGIQDLYTPDTVPNIAFDVVLVPDVIEHVPNVQDFLASLRRYKAGQIVITTPNAYRLVNRKLWQQELINTDHRYWFSPYTLSKTVVEAGYTVEAFYYTDVIARNPLKNLLRRQFPLCRDGLAIVIK